jgi:hypothetical protein
MKKVALFALLCLFMAACTKNYYSASTLPAFTVSGIEAVTLQQGSLTEAALSLTVKYEDSTQGNVTLSVSGLPAGVSLDTTQVMSGIPTFRTSLIFYDTSATAPAKPGTYPITITCTSATAAQKKFTFNMTVLPVQSVTANVVGKYNNCSSSCIGGVYTDSVYADTGVVNKIYFHNFMSTGQTVYANVTVENQEPGEYLITIPQQTVNGYTFFTNEGTYFNNEIFLEEVEYQFNGNTSFCSITMNR